jgi:hypothetical protein
MDMRDSRRGEGVSKRGIVRVAVDDAIFIEHDLRPKPTGNPELMPAIVPDQRGSRIDSALHPGKVQVEPHKVPRRRALRLGVEAVDTLTIQDLERRL